MLTYVVGNYTVVPQGSFIVMYYNIIVNRLHDIPFIQHGV